MTPRTLVGSYSGAARRSEISSGVPLQLTRAQVALEAGWGALTPGTGCIGIKADDSWAGKTQMLKTREEVNGRERIVQAALRAYDTPLDRFADPAASLRRKNHCVEAFPINAPRTFARQVAATDYATDPKDVTTRTPLIGQVEALSNATGAIFGRA